MPWSSMVGLQHSTAFRIRCPVAVRYDSAVSEHHAHKTGGNAFNRIGPLAFALNAQLLCEATYPLVRQPMGASLSSEVFPDWQDECAHRFNCSSFGLVDRYGHLLQEMCSPEAVPTDGWSIPAAAWGITAEACFRVCGPDVMTQVNISLFRRRDPIIHQE